MKKRGDINLWFLVDLTAFIFVVYLATTIAVENVQGTIHEKLNIAKDLSMQINTLSSVPGDAYIINRDLHGYSLFFSNNKVEVFNDDLDLAKGIYYFVKIGDSNIDLRLDKPKQVVISKINNEIIVSGEIPDLN